MKKILLIVCMIFFYAGHAQAQSISLTKTPDTLPENVIEFIEGEYIFSKGLKPPQTGWEQASNPNIDQGNKTNQPVGEFRSLFARFYFERDMIGTGAAAIHTLGTRGNFSISVNGIEVFRNFADISDNKNPWYRPFLIPIPSNTLNDGINEITVHSFSKKIVGTGRIFVGANSALQAYNQSLYFWHITAPTAASFACLVISILVLIFWFARRQEIELLWLSIASFLWFIRNHQYFVEQIPFSTSLYVALTVCSTYFATASTAAFFFCSIKLPKRNLINLTMFIIGTTLALIYVSFSTSSIYLYLATLAVIAIVAVTALGDIVKHNDSERRILGLGLILMPIATIHDVAMLILYEGDGHATYIAVFCGPIFAATFILSFGKRVLNVLDDLSKSNLVLKKNISHIRAELMESETARQELLVSQALTNERSRLMQEMHDGIGSNLTTALAVAHKQKYPDHSIKVLRKALGDLKLTVDSLEPVEGDLVSLIGNLRHRMARDLSDAGIDCKWQVEECKPLEWLDAANALHVLRIHNEAISNVLAHSNATEMRIGCIENEQDGIAGISTFVADNGSGFDMTTEMQGKGLANMKARAHSLHGKLIYESEEGKGTKITLWLPYIRQNA